MKAVNDQSKKEADERKSPQPKAIQKIIEEEEKKVIEKQCSGTELSLEEMKDMKHVALGNTGGPCGECTKRQLERMGGSMPMTASQIETVSEDSTASDTDSVDEMLAQVSEYDNALF